MTAGYDGTAGRRQIHDLLGLLKTIQDTVVKFANVMGALLE